MRVVMVMFRADGQRRSFSVTRDMTVIGRREDCDLRIPLGDVSRKHCRIIMDGRIMRVEDLGSSNGTFKNGERIQQTEVSAGDTLQVGPVVFVLQVDGTPAEDDMQPVTAQSLAATASAATNAPTTNGEHEDDEPMLVEDDEENAGLPKAERTSGEFDPMEALEAAEGSAFDFQIDESQHGEQSPVVDLDESKPG